jgi:hypothetical protein
MMNAIRSPVRRLLIGAIAFAAASVPLAAATPAATAPEPQLMFVQLSNAMTSDPATKTLRLVGVNPQSLYFADRPVRLAGHLKMDEYLAKWTAQAGARTISATIRPMRRSASMKRARPTARWR